MFKVSYPWYDHAQIYAHTASCFQWSLTVYSVLTYLFGNSCAQIFFSDISKGLDMLDYHLLYRHECFTGKYTTRKIHKNYIRDPGGLFSIISHVSLSMT